MSVCYYYLEISSFLLLIYHNISEEIIRRRLMIDGDGTGDARVMMMFMKFFIKWCSTDDSPQEW